ncbi:trimethylamine methyltransferase family protein [Candidatus Hecatella orcuttiae]|jgi:trimethylamine--corrinoid protein Co-methyltransferase|uniref:trimethylamine methyltransferase family protein n=1 Tax=Candidatus Hecatella orcuttiae TaxID=1935119 RepID=UPI00286823B8|nr:trimethylamine methyltransferase family protein [Candidatus Hecatella orcuttiae]
MVLNGFPLNIKPLEILSDEQVEAIHRGTLDILQETGVRFEHDKALKLFADSGCHVDFQKRLVKIPDYLVEECLRKAPSSFAVKARDPKNTVRIGGTTVYMMSNCGMNTLDLDTLEPKTPTLQDQDDFVKVLDALEHVHILGYGPHHNFQGVHPLMTLPMGCASRIRNSTKAMDAGGIKKCQVWNIKMAKATGQQLLGIVTVSPPLTYYSDAVEAAFDYVEVGFPVELWSGAVYGGSGPVTLAGATVMTNAELLAALVLAQLIRPGIGVIPYDFTFPIDMQRGHPFFGAVEICLHSMAFNQIWRHYRIPCGNAFFWSGKAVDYQCGYERAVSTFLAALSGANVICALGGGSMELTAHPVIAVLDDDVMGMVKRVLEGMDVSEETLAVNLIEEVGPIPGHYLNREHTRRWWKKELFIPKVADRTSYPEWVQGGKKTALENAKTRVKEILSTHTPTPLPKDQDEEINRILREAEEWYKKQGWW